MRQLKLVPGKYVVQLVDDSGEVLAEVLDYTLHFLVSEGLPLTVESYIRLNTMGDCSSLDELGPEDRAEIERLLEDGFLVDTNSNDVN